MSNAMENARKILNYYDEDNWPIESRSEGVLVDVLRELLESVAVEHRDTDSRGYPFASLDEEWAYMGPTIQEIRYVTPWERA